MINRVIIFVLDSFGVGEAPDANLYGDQGSNTLVNIYNSTNLIFYFYYIFIQFKLCGKLTIN